MDAVKIIEESPKASDAYGNWLRNFEWECDCGELYSGTNLRDIYDFFDDAKIYISVYLSANADRKLWRFAIYCEEEDCEFEGVFDSRERAEGAAFEESFRILEGRLS